VYGELPTDEEVQRVRIYLVELSKYEKEVQDKAEQEREETRRRLERMRK
jgi:hypothetical protein